MREKLDSLIKKFESLDRALAALPAHETDKMTVLAKERKKMEPVVTAAQEWIRLRDELNALEELLAGEDASMRELAKSEKDQLSKKLEDVQRGLSRMLHPPDLREDMNTVVEIRAGAGGDEAGLFVSELYRMLGHFSQSKGLKVISLSSSPTGIGGLKEIIFEVQGSGAFGWLRFEQGVHRVQRVPATESQGRIHTSTATVAVLPEPTDVEVNIDSKDLRIDTYRSSGAGGQHVNKTDSAIRITHIPSGIVVQCQEERSQGQNRMKAMALLRARLQEAAEQKASNERRDMRRKQVGTGDRSEKIRTYNFPQDRITDHRINFTMHNIEKFMSGDMDEMVNALRSKEEELNQ